MNDMPCFRHFYTVRNFAILGIAASLFILGACQFQQETRTVQGQILGVPKRAKTAATDGLEATAKTEINIASPSVSEKKYDLGVLGDNVANSKALGKGFPTGVVPLPDIPSLSHLLDQKPKKGPLFSREKQPSIPIPMGSDSIRAAILLPLSGVNAEVGQAMLNAAQLAIFDFADSRLELLPVDTRGTPAGAQEAASSVIGDRVQIILGPLLSTSVRAIAPVTRAAGVPIIAFSSDRSVAGDGIYTMGFLPDEQVSRVIEYAFQKNILRFAVLAPDNKYGKTVFNTIKRTVKKIGAQLVDARFYNPDSVDFSQVVRGLANYDERRGALLKQREALKASNDNLAKNALKRLEALQTIGDLPFDALLVADGGKRLQSVAALLPFYDIDPSKVKVLGTGQWDVPGIGAEPALLDAWYAAPQPSARAEFVAVYSDNFGHIPPRLATLAYDATALTAVLSKARGGPDFSAATLTMPNGFEGRDGIFRFLPGGAIERGLAVLQVQQKNAKVISPAPITFKTAVN